MFEPLDPVKLRGVAGMLALELNQRLRDRNMTMVGTHTSLANICSRLMASKLHDHQASWTPACWSCAEACFLHAPQALRSYLEERLVPPGGSLPMGTSFALG